MSKKVDILNRDEFIQRVVDIVKLIASNKGNMTFAIDGTWGCGKTFVLEEIEDRLSNDPSKNYLVIPYNCWQYDYYDEPLVALVSSLLDFLKKTKRVSPKRKEKIVAIAKQLGKAAFSVGAHLLEYKTGLNLEKEAEAAKDIIDGIDEVSGINERSFDPNFDLKDTLEKLKKELAKLSNDKAIVFCVDELDRCLPEYAIKVLERLHHLTEELPNTITIIAVDKKRLENTVCSIFGKEDVKDPKKTAEEYLKKFIRFEMKLDNGKQNGQAFFDRFPEFYNRFDASLYGELNGGEQFIEELFFDVPVREQEQIVEKASVFNDLCFGSEKQDYSMMYMELFLATSYYYYREDSIFSDNKRSSNLENVFGNYRNMPPKFKSKDSGFCFKRATIQVGYPGHRIVTDSSNIFMVVFLYWFHAPKYNGDLRDSDVFPTYREGDKRLFENIEKLRKHLEVLKAIV